MAFGALEGRAARITIVNRTVEKAQSLASDLRALYPGAEATALSPHGNVEEVRSALREADLVANATSLGLKEGDPPPCDPADLSPQSLVFDAAYTAQRSTAWLRAATARGCATLDGVGMLVRQGAASFRIWTGVEPDLDAMFEALPFPRCGTNDPA